MNIRRNFFYVLLSLLLVFSQQMGYSHALSHASASTGMVQADAQPDEDASGVTKLGLDHNCAKCLAFAQIAAAADTHFYSFPLAAGTSVDVVHAPAPLDCQRTVCGFRSRAPPVLS